MAAGKQVQALGQFAAVVDGRTVVVLAGTRFPAGSPLVKANPERFGPVRS
jgi:hypothetical protein